MVNVNYTLDKIHVKYRIAWWGQQGNYPKSVVIPRSCSKRECFLMAFVHTFWPAWIAFCVKAIWTNRWSQHCRSEVPDSDWSKQTTQPVLRQRKVTQRMREVVYIVSHNLILTVSIFDFSLVLYSHDGSITAGLTFLFTSVDRYQIICVYAKVSPDVILCVCQIHTENPGIYSLRRSQNMWSKYGPD